MGFPVRDKTAHITNVFRRPGNYAWNPDGTHRHTGLDIAADGTKVNIHAAREGVVVHSSYDFDGYGNYIIIYSKGKKGGRVDCLYAHMSSVKVSVGQVVKTGDVVGIMGTTGNSTGQHLHYEESKYGSDWAYGNVRNPYFPWYADTLWDKAHFIRINQLKSQRKAMGTF